MKTFLTVAFTFLLAYDCHSQDTLRKVIEYDITIDAVAQMDIPVIKYLVQKGGNNTWLKVLLDEIIAGEIAAYDMGYKERVDRETIRKYVAGEIYDTVYVVDPIAYVSSMDVIQADPWSIDKIVLIRFTEQWTWNEELNEMQLDYRGFMPMMEIFRKGVLVGHLSLFFIKLNN